MIKVEHSIIIDRPVAEVFAFVTDPANNPKWQEGLVESRLESPGPIQPGAQIVDVRKFLGREMESRLNVKILELNKRFVQEVVTGPVAFEIIQTFEPAVSGTRLTVLAQGEPGGFFKLASGMVQKQFESQLKADADRLKKVIEES